MRIEFNLITQRETALDKPMLWYGALAVLAVVVPLAALGTVQAGLGEHSTLLGRVRDLEKRIAALNRPRKWDRNHLDELSRRAGEAGEIARRSSTRPLALVRGLADLMPGGVRLTRLDLGSAGRPEKVLEGEARDREALSSFLVRLGSDQGRVIVYRYELRSEVRSRRANGAGSQTGPAPGEGPVPIRFALAFELSGGGL